MSGSSSNAVFLVAFLANRVAVCVFCSVFTAAEPTAPHMDITPKPPSSPPPPSNLEPELAKEPVEATHHKLR